MGRSERTTRAYESDWQQFRAWCDQHGARSSRATGATVARFVDEQVGAARMATVRRRLAAIRAHHIDRGLTSPTATREVRIAVARAEWRLRDDARPAPPLGVPELRAISRAAPATRAGIRDRALVLLGYGGGLRPGELAALRFEDVKMGRRGVAMRLASREVVVPLGSSPELCAVTAWSAWWVASPDRSGPAFRPIDRHGRVGAGSLGTRGVTRIVQRSVARAGLDSEQYSGSSLRRGTVLAATYSGATEGRIMDHTGHRSRRLVRRYMREARTSAGLIAR